MATTSGARVRLAHYTRHLANRPDTHAHRTEHGLLIKHTHGPLDRIVGHDHSIDPPLPKETPCPAT